MAEQLLSPANQTYKENSRVRHCERSEACLSADFAI